MKSLETVETIESSVRQDVECPFPAPPIASRKGKQRV